MEIRRVRILLKPTQQQEKQFLLYVDFARRAYNLGLEWMVSNYNQTLTTLSYEDLSRKLTIFKQSNPDFYQIDSHTLKQAMKNVSQAFKNFFTKTSKFPRFKSYKHTRKSFYVRQDKVVLTTKAVKLSSLGTIKSKPCHWLLTNLLNDNQPFKVYNPYIVYDNKHWFLTLGVEVELQLEQLNPINLGLDFGINHTITTSSNKQYPNINKQPKLLKLNKKKKRLQRKLARKYELNKQPNNQFMKTNNIKKLEQRIKLIDRRITNIKENYVHEILNDIVRQLPQVITIEDLKIKNMLKNRYLARSIQDQRFYRLRQLLQEKCKNNFIQLRIANTFFPSSKQCSQCKQIKKNLTLSDRVYHCNHCNTKLDRDLNAAINLRDCNNYRLA